MYDRGIKAVIPSYNSGMKVYVNPDKTIEEINAAIDAIRAAIEESVSGYEEGVPATYGIINPSFENLSAQNDTPTSGLATSPVPFGWTLTRNGTIVNNPSWQWCSINTDGGVYKDGNYIWGVFNYGAEYGNIEMSQTLKGLQNGTWRLTAQLMNNHLEDGNLARIFANNSSMLAGNKSDYSSLPQGETCTFSGKWSTADNDMSQLMTVETEVTDGTMKFGARANGFFKIDNFRLTFLGSADAINATSLQSSHNLYSAIYDLAGCRLASLPQKGIYIQNGRKYIIK